MEVASAEPRINHNGGSLVLSRSEADGEELCATCQQIDFRVALNLRPENPVSRTQFFGWSQPLGYLKDISSRTYCSFCRLIVHSLLARWPVIPCVIEDILNAKTIDSDKVKCYAHRTEAGRRGTAYQAAQISISTNIELPVGFPLPLNSHGDIAVLAEDAQALGQEPLYHGRLLGKTLDLDRVRGWLEHCERKHFCRCDHAPWEHIRLIPKGLRLIDVKKRCLVRAPAFPRYIALSYVWGKVKLLQTVKSNYQQLTREQSFSQVGMSMSPVVEDAIQLMEHLKERYLWVDQLCIIQDDPEDKLLQIGQMDLVYAHAVLTIVAACGEDAGSRLVGLNPDSANRVQTSEVVNGLRLVVPLPTIPHALGSSTWNTRAWTFQEYQLSRRRLLFTDKQVYFQCRCDVMAEDVVCEAPSSCFNFNRDNTNHRVQSFGIGTGLGERQWPFTLSDYAIAIELYTAKHLSFPGDVLIAFLGIQNALQKAAKWKFWNGLPEDIFDYAILWRPKGELIRRIFDPGSANHARTMLPTLSWAGWIGSISLSPRTEDLVSHVEAFEIRQKDRVRAIKRRMHMAPVTGLGDQLRITYDRSTEPFFLQLGFPGFSNALQTIKRLLNIPEWSSSRDDIVQSLEVSVPAAETLHFLSLSAVFRVSREPIARNLTRGERNQGVGSSRALGSPFDELSARDECQRHWIYDRTDPGRRVGTVWRVSLMEEEEKHFDLETAEFILLSQSRCRQEDVEGWQFDTTAWDWHEWCMCNVMLVRRKLDGTGAERVTIGKIHYDAWQAAGPVKRPIVLL